jgi:hypothetical protein
MANPSKAGSAQRQILARVIEERSDDCGRAVGAALDALERALQAHRMVVAKGGRGGAVARVSGPDHAVALDSVETLIRMLTTGRAHPRPAPEPDRTGITIDVLLDVLDGKVKKTNPASVQVLPTFLAVRHEQVERLLLRAIEVIATAAAAQDVNVRAIRQTLLRPGMVFDAGPDYRTQLKAARLLTRLATAGRPLPPPTTTAVWTLEGVLELADHRERQIEESERQRATGELENQKRVAEAGAAKAAQFKRDVLRRLGAPVF